MSGRLVRDVFLTVAEVAERLRVNPQTVRNWIDRGRLPATRVGRRVRVRQADLGRFIAQGATGPADASVSTRTGQPSSAKSATSAPPVPGAHEAFLDAACDFVRLLVPDGSGELVSSLRMLARQAEHWADALESQPMS